MSADGILHSSGAKNDWDGVQNFIANGHAEVDTTGWATFADAAASRPVDGTGGAPSVTWTRGTSSPLNGQGEFLFTKDAVNRQGNGASYDFSIPIMHRAKALSVKIPYIVKSGTFVAGTSSTDSDVIIYFYDITNSKLVEANSLKLLSNSTTIGDVFQAQVQFDSNCASARAIVYCASASASAYVLAFKEIFVGPSQYAYGTPVTDWQTHTTAMTLTNVATSSVVTRQRRVGDSVEFEGRVVVSAAPTGTIFINLPTGMTVDTTKISSADAASPVGIAHMLRTAVGRYEGQVIYNNSTSFTIYNNDVQGVWGPTVPATWASPDSFSFRFTVPIAGLSSSVQMSEETSTRVVAVQMSGAPADVTAANPIIFPTVANDSLGLYSTVTGKYTASVPGYYRLTASVLGTIASGQYAYVSVNNNVSSGTNRPTIGYTFAANGFLQGSGVVFVKSGDTIDLRPNVGFTAINALSTMSIERISGPNQIAASESVNARAYASATSINGSLATIVFTTADFDSHGGYSSGTYTVQVAGRYQVNSALAIAGTFALNNTCIMELQKNGTAVSATTVYAGGAVTNQNIAIDDVIKCNAGDTIRIQLSSSATTPTIVSSNTKNFFSLARVGN